MARRLRLSRRGFLVGTAAVAGGLAVGVVALRREPPNPLLREPAGGHALNAYVRIDADGVTLITPRADLGQGAISIQAALIAEELDLAWGEFRVEPGPPDKAYYNGTVAAESLPIAATNDSLVARGGRAMGDLFARVIGLQVTGGSTTVPDSHERLRVAGAVARQMLIAAAAWRAHVEPEGLSTRDGHVLLPDGRQFAYTELASIAATLKPPREVALKPPEAWRYLGRPMRRLDIVPKSTGTAVYGIDLRLPGMVHATVRTNPRRGGGLRSFDTTAAEKARGVLKIVPLPDGFGVIADNTWRAFRAAALVEADWGPAPYPPSTEALFDAVAACFDDEHRDSRLRDDGNVEQALAAAAGDGPPLEAEYRVPYLAHAPLEPMTAVAQLKNGRLDIWAATQIPRFVVDHAAALTGLDASQVDLHVQICGGSFGRRLEDDQAMQAVMLANAYPGVPVKLTWSREEDMTHDFPRPLAIGRARGRVRDGRVEAFDLSIASPSVTASQMGRLGMPSAGPDPQLVAGAWDQPFAIPHRRVTGYRAPPSVPVSSWRSVGASGNAFLHECFLDELIRAAGADPLAERLRLCDHEPSRRVLEAVGAMAGWSSPLADRGDGPRGRGLAFTLSFGVPVAQVVEVTATARGIRLDRVCVVAEVGRVLDPINLEAQLQGSVIWGLGHAIHCELTYADGRPEQTNFDRYPSLTLRETPPIEVRALETTDTIRGIGEPGVPPAAPALANAIFAATGRRLRQLPLAKAIDFV